jgi:cystathionine beta-lyase family protein involved in aluminum resistance
MRLTYHVLKQNWEKTEMKEEQMNPLGLSKTVVDLAQRAEEEIKEEFARTDRIALTNSQKVLAAFQKYRVADGCFAGTTGYGYDDKGRDVLDQIYAEVFHAEAALVRIGFVNGTHAITSALFGVLRPGDTLVSVTGAPYDTLMGVINGTGVGSLQEFGVSYEQVELCEDGTPDFEAVSKAVSADGVKAAFISRSRGYSTRPSLCIEQIGALCACIKKANPQVVILVDNCYGEFVEMQEPTDVGADLIAGSLIKNPGGGLAPTGGYLAGREDLVQMAAMRLTAPGIGGECGPTVGQNRLLYQGFFLAPHVVAQALKTAIFTAKIMEKLGYQTDPTSYAARTDIVQTISFGASGPVCRFCKGIQMGAPVDSFVTPEPWDMPGYDCKVIMAAGAFVQGASIELSCDAPMRSPYLAYLQGGLTYESGKTGVLLAVQALLAGQE